LRPWVALAVEVAVAVEVGVALEVAVASVGRTLLSDAFDSDLDVAFDSDTDKDGSESRSSVGLFVEKGATTDTHGIRCNVR
jgi:hypothetical protein